MSKIMNKALGYLATTAEEAFWEALGLASKGGLYEPELSDEAKLLKTEHKSKISAVYNKLAKI